MLSSFCSPPVFSFIISHFLFCKDSEQALRSLLSKNEFYAIQSEKFVNETFMGSLPAFIAAFGSRKRPSTEDLKEIRKIIDSFEEEQ
ncbi:MAG: BlaI/MecI/CopY family transcriptional regulator [Clostridia bacterium]|nr:BlaI/MecI/CopY family transcriptional regulator [Clostridia bacterium]